MKKENKPIFPFTMDVQLFAELEEVIDDTENTTPFTDNDEKDDTLPFGDLAEEDETLDDDLQELETEEEDNQNTTDDNAEEEFEEIIYNGEKIKIPVKDKITYLQKGYNYDKIKHKAEQAQTALERAARVSGFDKVEDYLAEVERVERENEAQRYQEAANDPEKLKQLIEENPAIKEAKRIQFENQIAKQKEAFKEKRFFKQLEPEIDNLLRTIPNVDVRTVYNYLVGEKLDELLEKEKQNVKKSTIADIADKSKRSAGNVSSDGGVDDVDISNIDIDMARAFGNDPKEIAKYKKQHMKRR